MDEAKEAEFDALVKELVQEANHAILRIGFVKAAIEERKMIADRLRDSTSGYAGAVAKHSVAVCLILYCTRAWDTYPKATRDNNKISLRRAFHELPDIEEMAERRMRQLKELGISFDRGRLEKRYDAFKDEFRATEELPYHNHFRLLRTEELAHRISESFDRRKLLDDEIAIVQSTYRNLLDLAISTVGVVDKLDNLWNSNGYNHRDSITRADRLCREFWRHVPILRDVEASEQA